MIYFLLPNVNITIYKQIDCLFSKEIPEISISNSLCHYLYEIKNKIKKYEQDWNDFKKYTNPYEFINTIIPGKNKCVAKYKSLSRSYFKMIEIMQFLNDVVEPCDVFMMSQSKIRTFHLAEGPGGFIEAISNIRNNPDDSYYGMTILDDNENNKLYSLPDSYENGSGMNVPGWKKSEQFLKSHPNVTLEYGADCTGNILSLQNLLYCREKYRASMDLITGDGGFDFSIDYNNQEMNISVLLFAQVCYALCLQKQCGDFILKIFDIFMEQSVDIIYILSAFYEKVYITKPQTSRYANSEKYLVCKNFLVANDNGVFPFLKTAFQKMLENLKSPEKQYISRFLKIPISSFYVYKLEEYNAIFGQQQIENIYQTMILIENKYKYGDDRKQYNSGRDSGAGEIIDSKSINNNATHTYSQDGLNSSRFLTLKEIHTSPEEQNLNILPFNVYPIKNKMDDMTELGTDASSEKNQLWDKGLDASLSSQSNSHIGNWNRKTNHSIHPKIENLIRTNIQKSIQWCIKYGVTYYTYDM